MNAPTPFAAQARALYDRDTRRQIRADPQRHAIDHDFIPADAGIEVKVVTNTPDTVYMPLPSVAPGDSLGAPDLQAIQGGVRTGTAGSGGSVSTAGSVCTTASTASSVGTIGTAASG